MSELKVRPPKERSNGGGHGGADLLEDAAEGGDEEEVEQRGDKGGEGGPDHDGVPGGGPEQLDGGPEICVREFVNLRHADGQMWSAKQFFAQAEEGNQKRDLQRIKEVVHQLDGGEIQTPDEGNQRAQRGVPPDGGEKAEDRAEGDAQRQLLRA